MDVDTSVIIDLWEVIAENVPNSRKEELATKLVSIFAKEGVEKNEFNSILGEDDYIDNAVEHYFSDEEDDYPIYDSDEYDE
jgi:hypothetical protein